jgi:transposase InsO family protein
MIHVDVKKLGRIPNSGGHRIHGQVQGEANSRARNLAQGQSKNRGQVRGYTFLHHAVDDHSRFVYSEILPHETKEAASAFMRQAIAAFAAHGVKIQRVLTENGACYRSRAFASVLADAGIRHKRTRPYRPQTNGKVERFNRVLQEEWAYAKAYGSETERQACYPDFHGYYNQRRPHTALKGASPIDRVTNQPGQYT